MPYGGGMELASVATPRPTRNVAEIEANRKKRMTWHGALEDVEDGSSISGIVDPMERAHLADEPRPVRRPRASTYVPAPNRIMPSAPSVPTVSVLPSVDSLLNSPDSTPRQSATPRTIPRYENALPPITGLTPKFAEGRRPGGSRGEHSRSRSASHIQYSSDIFNPAPSRAPYAENLAEQRGQRRPGLTSGLTIAPQGPSLNADAMFRSQLRNFRSDASEGIAPPRPLEPSFGTGKPEFAPEKGKDAGFVFGDHITPTTVAASRPRARTTVGTNGDTPKFVYPPSSAPRDPQRMAIFEPDIFEHRPVSCTTRT